MDLDGTPALRTKRRRRPVAMLVAASVVLAGCAAMPASHADYPGFGSIVEIGSAADLVVRVAYVDDIEDVVHPAELAEDDPTLNPQAGVDDNEIDAARRDGAVPVTISTVRILEVLKGEPRVVGDRIEVSQVGTREQPNAETTLLSTLSPDASAVVFLRAWGESPYDLLNPEQGMFLVSSAGQVRPLSTDTAFAIETLDELRSVIGWSESPPAY